jgi:hypothetical protein
MIMTQGSMLASHVPQVMTQPGAGQITTFPLCQRDSDTF